MVPPPIHDSHIKRANIAIDHLERLYPTTRYTIDGKYELTETSNVTNYDISPYLVDVEYVADLIEPVALADIDGETVAITGDDEPGELAKKMSAIKTKAEEYQPVTTIEPTAFGEFLSCTTGFGKLSLFINDILDTETKFDEHIEAFWSNVIRKWVTFLVTLPKNATESLKKLNAVEQDVDNLEPTPHVKVLRKTIRELLDVEDQLDEELVTHLSYNHIEFSNLLLEGVVTDKVMADIIRGRMPNSFPKGKLYIKLIGKKLDKLVISEFAVLARTSKSLPKGVGKSLDPKASNFAIQLGHLYGSLPYVMMAALLKNNVVGWTRIRSDLLIANLIFSINHFRDVALKLVMLNPLSIDAIDHGTLRTLPQFVDKALPLLYEPSKNQPKGARVSATEQFINNSTTELTPFGMQLTRELREMAVAMRIRQAFMTMVGSQGKVLLVDGFVYLIILGFVICGYALLPSLLALFSNPSVTTIASTASLAVVIGVVIFYFIKFAYMNIRRSIDGKSMAMVNSITASLQTLSSLIPAPTGTVKVQGGKEEELQAVIKASMARYVKATGIRGEEIGKMVGKRVDGGIYLFPTDDVNSSGNFTSSYHGAQKRSSFAVSRYDVSGLHANSASTIKIIYAILLILSIVLLGGVLYSVTTYASSGTGAPKTLSFPIPAWYNK